MEQEKDPAITAAEHTYKPLSGKRILLGVTGGIAAFKAAEYVRGLVKLGAEIQVVMTQNATKFVGPVTFSALSGRPALTSMFHTPQEISHIQLAQWADLMMILPATANTLAKLAWGVADDLLTTVFLAYKGPKLLFPSMNPNMFENPATQANISRLRQWNIQVVEPEQGTVVCGAKGRGRLVDLDEVIHAVKTSLWKKDLGGMRVLVTSGPTREPLDPVRFISNRSSGKMGMALANDASIRGAKTLLVTGPTCLRLPKWLETRQVETASQMAKEVFNVSSTMDIIIMAAAVADYTPMEYTGRKIKKTGKTLNLSLKRTTDILLELGQNKPAGQILVGFCAETHDIVDNAFKKLRAKNLDLIVANDVTEPGAGFQWDTNKVFLIDTEENVEELPLLHKEEVAERILDKVVQIRSRMMM